MWLFGGSNQDDGMDLYIGNLPDKTSIHDIELLLGDFAADASLKFSNKLFVDGTCTNFCVLSFSSRKKAEKAMKALRLKKLAGEYLAIHEFHYRTYHNERRETPYSPIHEGESSNNNRQGDRRRMEQEIDPFAPEPEVVEAGDESQIRVSGYNAFARKG